MSQNDGTRSRPLSMDILQSRIFRRVATTLLAFCFAAAFMLSVFSFTPESAIPEVKIADGMPTMVSHKTTSCASENISGSRDLWEKAQKKYSHLMNDKFTIAIQTYDRPDELAKTLRALLKEKVPSLLEVVVVWNNVDTEPPDNFSSEHGVPVRYRASPRNSLNQKLWPDPAYRTQAILLSDDDVYYHPSDLEFAFQSWRKFGKARLTGALARCSTKSKSSKLAYTFCSKEKESDVYSMVLTNLAFSHISFMDYYSSNDAAMVRIRDYVDKHMNCEDIALNHVSSLLTGTGPLLVTGRERYVNYEPAAGISKKPGHIEARSKCLEDFADILGCRALVEETAHIQRGVVVL